MEKRNMSVPYNITDVVTILGLHIDISIKDEHHPEKAALALEKCLRRLMNQSVDQVRECILKVIMAEPSYEERLSKIRHLLGSIEVADYVPLQEAV